tara:strand:+ start:1054 stop:1485 length:432 start_codon:yes stop_codon:yes gene_type:complete
MVCLGNICRSPIAEGILKSKLPEKTFEVDSAGTEGFHIGRSPDPRSIEIAAQNGINISKQTARKFIREDFKRFDRVYVMDRSNLKNIKQIAITEEEVNKVALLLENKEVPDPYYGNDNEFKKMFDLIDNACERISKKLLNSKS